MQISLWKMPLSTYRLKKDDADGRLNGYVRIRSKTQGIALSRCRITAIQRDDAEILAIEKSFFLSKFRNDELVGFFLYSE